MCYFFNEIKVHLKHCTQKDKFGQYMLADSINHKIEEYWTIIDDATMIASLLDPEIKVLSLKLEKKQQRQLMP